MDAWALQNVMGKCELEAKHLTDLKGNPLMLAKAKLTWDIINGWSLDATKLYLSCTAPTLWIILTSLATLALTKASKEVKKHTRDATMVRGIFLHIVDVTPLYADSDCLAALAPLHCPGYGNHNHNADVCTEPSNKPLSETHQCMALCEYSFVWAISCLQLDGALNGIHHGY
jgi:hypothetical protein